MGRALAWVALVLVLTVLVISTFPTGAQGALPPQFSTGRSTAAASPASPTSPAASSLLLHQATAKLQAGSGPAYLRGAACVPTGGGQTVSCRASSSSPVPSLGWSPIGSPLGRSAVTMAYDAADGYVVLFSDGSSSAVQGDTWIFQAGHWTELTLSVSPGPRLGAYMAYDSTDGYVLLFGGWGGNSGPYEYGDTWAFSGGAWHLLIPESSCAGEGGSLPCPVARDSGSMADDPASAMVILFGGYGGFGDTWGFAAGSWIPLIPQSSCAGSGGSTLCPSPRDSAAMAWDPSLSGDVLFGGSGPTNDTWLFKSGSWLPLIDPVNCTAPSGANPCPSPREEASMAFDYADNELVLFGGYNGSADLSDTWAFHAGSWHLLPSASGCRSCPAGRSEAGFVYVPALGADLLFGGYSYRGDSWTFSGGAWSPLVMAETPGPRWDASLSWDPVDQAVLLFGGSDGSVLGDTWTFVHGDWSEVLPSTSCSASSCPSPRQGAALAWDGTDHVMVLFGGMSSTSGGFLRDTWSYARGNWSLLIPGSSCTSTTCPSARANASMVWDPADSEVVLFGGYGGSYEGDTWAFSSGSWSEVLSPTQCGSQPCPTPRESASLAQAPPPSGGAVLFGGATASGPTNDTWQFARGAWTELLSPSLCRSQPCPSVRSGAAMALDPVSGTVDLFGGANGSRTLADTWVFTGSNWTSVSLYGPSGRGFAMFAQDPADGYLLLVGGRSSYAPAPDVWALGPSLNAGTPTATPSTVDVGATVSFDAFVSGSGTVPTWTAWQGLPPGCAPPAGGLSSFSCAPSSSGTSYVTAVTTFGNGLPGLTSNFLTVTVNTDPTVVLSAHPPTTFLGSNFTLWANASGGTGPFTTYSWSGLPVSCSAPPSANSTLTCLPVNSSDLGSWQVRVSAVDATGFNVSSSAMTLQVVPAPWSVSIGLSPPFLDLGQYEIMSAAVSGLVGGASFVWSGLPPGCSGSIGSVLCLPTAAGTYAVSVVATAADPALGSATSAPAQLTIYPALNLSAVTPSSAHLALGSTLTLTPSVSGGDPPYAYLWNGLPSGCTGGDSAQVSCVPRSVGNFTISLQVSDALGSGTPIVQTLVEVNATPAGVLLSATRTALDVGETTTMGATLLGAVAANTSYQWLGLPAGCTGLGSTAQCTPLSPGVSSVEVEATVPPALHLLSNVVTLSVGDGLSAAVISESSGDLPAGSTLSLAGGATGGTGPDTFVWGGLPAGCVGADSSTLTCVPTQPGSYTVALEVVDATGASANTTAPLVVVPAPTSTAPSGSSSNGPGSIDWFAYALVVAALVLATLILLVLLFGKRRGGAPRDPSASTEPAPESPEGAFEPRSLDGPANGPTARPPQGSPPGPPTRGRVGGPSTAQPLPTPSSNGMARAGPVLLGSRGGVYRPVPLQGSTGGGETPRP